MTTADWSTVDVLSYVQWSCFMQCCYLFIYLIFSDMFIYGTRNFHSRRTRNEKSAPISGTRKWSRFIVSGACNGLYDISAMLSVDACEHSLSDTYRQENVEHWWTSTSLPRALLQTALLCDAPTTHMKYSNKYRPLTIGGARVYIASMVHISNSYHVNILRLIVHWIST